MENIIKNKKAITPRNWILISILVSMIFISSGVWIAEWDGKYYQNDTTYNVSKYNYIDQTRTSLETMEDKIRTEEDASTLGLLDFVIKGAYQALLIVLAVPQSLYTIVTDLGSEYGIPDAIINGFIVLILSGLIFGILGTLFRRKT